MLKLGTIVIVVLISLISSHGLRLQPKDVLHLLEVLKVKDDLEMREREFQDNQSKDDSEENNNMSGLLKKMDIIDLIEKADKGSAKTKFGEIKLSRDELQKTDYRDYELVAANQGNDVIEELVQGKGSLDFQKRNHHLLNPNNLLGTSQIDDGHRDPNDPLNEYFKVFVVIDPVALEKSKKDDALLKMISKIYALSPSLPQAARLNREHNQNSRFKVKNNPMSRRYRRESREGYDDDDYKPSRSRHDDGGNGFGGGRTGIPYMRPRGDIYEKN